MLLGGCVFILGAFHANLDNHKTTKTESYLVPLEEAMIQEKKYEKNDCGTIVLINLDFKSDFFPLISLLIQRYYRTTARPKNKQHLDSPTR